jgi:geranylgeranyl diphosphate synthase type I
MMEYALGWTEEDGTPRPGNQPLRLHASLCLLTCRAFGAQAERALPSALAVELVHNFSLVHDDVQEGNPDRDFRPAVWWVWGPAQAINAGDSLDTLARLSILDLAGAGAGPEEVMRSAQVLDQSGLELVEGQYQDIQFQEQLRVSGKAYLDMVDQRAGALLGCAAELGAMAAQADEGQRDLCREAGRKLATAIQIHNDVLSLWQTGGEQVPTGDVLNKKKSLPVIYALEHGEVQARRELGSFYLQRVLDPRNLPRIIEILDAAESRQHCRQVVEEVKQEALEAMRQSGFPEWAMEEIQDVAEYLLRDDA